MLVPVATVAKRAVQVFVAPLVGAARSRKRLMALAAVIMALAVGVISMTFNTAAAFWLVPIFLGVALVMGAANGLSSLAFQDMIGRILPRQHRSRLLFTQSSLAGLIVVIVAVGAQLLLRPGTSIAAHQELIWLGIGLFVLSALLTMMVREAAATLPSAEDGEAEDRSPENGAGDSERTSEHSFRSVLVLPWFGRFLIARTLYLSIELAIPFFSIHAATFHGNSISGLNAFVIAANVGLMAGGFLWAKIGKESIERILIPAAGITGIGGVLAIAIELGFASQSIYLYAVVFVLVSVGAQGIKSGRTLYLIGNTTDEERPFCIAVANATIGVIGIVFGALLGTLASLKGVAWPILALIVLNVVAALYTLRLRHHPVKPA
jgi:MFS family permease